MKNPIKANASPLEITKHVERSKFAREVERLYIYGPPKFQNQISTWCNEIGFAKGRIHFI
jgi:ferredoxin-NADP reductase